MSNKQPGLVVLDRDGVINHDSPDFIKTPDEWRPLPGSLDAIAALSRAGFQVVVATNQSGVGRGLLTSDDLNAIHRKMLDNIRATGGQLQGIFVCPHRPDEACECRKPKPGLLRQVEVKFSCSLANCPVIGDSVRDLEAANAVQARAILVRTGNGTATEQAMADNDDLLVFDDLAGAAEKLIDELD